MGLNECRQNRSCSNFAQSNIPYLFSGGSENIHEFTSVKL